MMNANQNDVRPPPDGDPTMRDTLSQFAQTTFTKDNFEAAGRVAKEKALELQQQAREGDRSLRFLAFVGGIGCTLVGLIELTSRLARLDLVGAIIDVYIVLLGFIVIALEGRDVFLSQQFLESLNKNALFLTFLWGRGALYFVCGTLQLTQIDLLNLIAGGYICFVGILYVVVGNSTAKKLRAIGVRKSMFTDETLRARFKAADIGGDGLTLEQFRSLCDDLGLGLAGREVEAAFGCIMQTAAGNGGNGTTDKLSYAAFKRWWDGLEGGDIDQPIGGDNPCMFV
mmetsp:Transcript_16761/g.38706  ORF Transcript_16761/g.38706 Transcript_16761/m.38706 type:complete len:284 (+) Transcript_16761:70-921(+)|eukprot:CAMPEP_0197177182 /NCGR_PEP_ID=MMETSP1423-20130617/2888_1 /TAXON_ID=476441 /ORGANISM="Pseudo-nitzschia heimii, Strain UNC1101" /LENGTH=283 /DNA_ID=CAMNT_0042626699 /DNA_START=25 /DNA_END=876 /DNA_ORIENTATION=-